MVYLIIGKQNISLRRQAKSIIKKALGEVDLMNYVKFDATNTLVQEIVDEATFIPLGYDNKAVVVENCYFLFKEKTKVKIDADQNFDKLLDYLNHTDEACELIFLANTSSNTINEKSPIYDAIKNNGIISTLEEPEDKKWKLVVAEYFKRKWPETVIDYDAVEELARRTEKDYGLLFNNADKLALYTDHITYEDVALMVTRPLEEKAYLLVNYLLENKNIDAVLLFRDLKSNKEEPVTLINMIANQFRLLNCVSYLSKHGYSDEEIGKELGINAVRAKILRGNSRTISQKKIKQTLEELYQLDLQIKSGLVDRYYSFELFLINFKRN